MALKLSNYKPQSYAKKPNETKRIEVHALPVKIATKVKSKHKRSKKNETPYVPCMNNILT